MATMTMEAFSRAQKNVDAVLHGKINIDGLIAKIEEKIFGDYVNAKFLIPYDRGDISSYICSEAVVKLMDYKETGTYFEVSIKNSDYQRFKKYEII